MATQKNYMATEKNRWALCAKRVGERSEEWERGVRSEEYTYISLLNFSNSCKKTPNYFARNSIYI